MARGPCWWGWSPPAPPTPVLWRCSRGPPTPEPAAAGWTASSTSTTSKVFPLWRYFSGTGFFGHKSPWDSVKPLICLQLDGLCAGRQQIQRHVPKCAWVVWGGGVGVLTRGLVGEGSFGHVPCIQGLVCRFETLHICSWGWSVSHIVPGAGSKSQFGTLGFRFRCSINLHQGL